MAVKGPCVFTSYLFFSICDEELFFRKVVFLTERATLLALARIPFSSLANSLVFLCYPSGSDRRRCPTH